MSFKYILNDEIEPGKPVRSDVFSRFKDNLEDHESRLLTIEQGAGTTYPPIIFRVNGPYWIAGPQIVGVLKTTVNFSMKILGVKILVDKPGTEGTLEIDIQTKTPYSSNWNSILSTRPSLFFTAPGDSFSTNGIINQNFSILNSGDILRLDINSVQKNAVGFLVRIDFAGV